MADSGTYDQATILRRQKLAEQMLAQDSQPPVVKNWAQGLSHLANIGADSFALNRLDKQAGEARKADTAALMAGLGLGDQPAATSPMPSASPTPSTPSPMPAPSPQVLGAGGKPETPDAQGAYSADAVMMPPSGGQDFGKAIAGIESGGKYDALGPVTKTGDRAYGKYQVMGNNIPEWTKTHLGQSMTPEQFLANPQAQDAVFKGQFGQYADKYGPEGAARAWFAGPGGMNNPNATDQLGTSVADYGKKFAANLGPQAAIAQAMTPGGATAFSGEPQPSAAAPPGGPPAPSGTPASPVAQAMTGGAPAPGGAPGGPPQGGTPIPGAPGGIAPSQKEAIARLLSATPGSAAQQLGLQLAGQVIKPNNFTFQTLPDGTVLRMDPTGRTAPTPVYQAPVKPQFVPNVSPNQYGVAQPGFVDPMKMQAFDIHGNPMAGSAPSAGAAGSVNPDVTGEDFLKTMPKPQADQIKGIVEGRISPPGAFALKTPYWQKMLTDVAQYEPGFDLTKWGARASTAKDFASGKSAQNITSFNTAIAHLDTLDKAADGLNNSRFPMVNSIKNMIASGTGEPAIKNFDVAKNAVTDELTRAFRGSGGSVHDVKQWEDAINAANSPAQLKAAIKQATELLRGRIESLGDTYNRGMNTKTEAIDLLSPKAKAALGRLSGEAPAEKGAPTAAAPTTTATPPAANTTKSGVTWSVE